MEVITMPLTMEQKNTEHRNIRRRLFDPTPEDQVENARERAEIERNVDELRAKAGYKPHVTVETFRPSFWEILGGSLFLYHDNGTMLDGDVPVIGYYPGFTTLPHDQQMASLAHELGHIIEGHIYTPISEVSKAKLRQQEYVSDQWAVKLGYGQALIDLMSQRFRDTVGLGDVDHPSNADRIAAIQRAMQAQEAQKVRTSYAGA